MAILEFFGIPRIRIAGLSLFNFVGTFIVTFILTTYFDFFKAKFTWMELSCLAIPCGVLTHMVTDSYTPLIGYAKSDHLWFSLIMTLAAIGIFKHWIFYVLLVINILGLILQYLLKRYGVIGKVAEKVAEKV